MSDAFWMPGPMREQIREELRGAYARYAIPRHLIPGIDRYFCDGILPGSFLRAVLHNDLAGAVAAADHESAAGLASLVAGLREYAPPHAWGSSARVLAWTTTGPDPAHPDDETTRALEDDRLRRAAQTVIDAFTVDTEALSTHERAYAIAILARGLNIPAPPPAPELELDPRVASALAAELFIKPALLVELQPLVVFQLAAILRMGLKHPKAGTLSASTAARNFLEAIAKYFEDAPAVTAILRGDQPAPPF